MENGLTRAEILKKLPKLKKGNFDLFCARAGLVHVGVRPSKTSHVMQYVYPADSIEKILAVMKKA